MAAAVQRIAIEAERHRFTLRQTRRTVPITGISDAQFAELIDACRRLDGLDGAARSLISLTIRP